MKTTAVFTLLCFSCYATVIHCSSSFKNEVINFNFFENFLRKFIIAKQLRPITFRSNVNISSSSSSITKTYKLTEWSDFHECSFACGGGRQQRNRKCLDNDGNEVLLKFCGNSSHNQSINSMDLLKRFLIGSNHFIESETSSCNVHQCGWCCMKFTCV